MSNDARLESEALDGLNISPFCLHLQSKKAYFRTTPPMEESDLLDASLSCWCRRTMQVLGPDKNRAEPSACRTGRGCFESIG